MKNYSLAGLKLSSPLVSAAGVMNGTDLDDIRARFNKALATDLGAITLGSYTILPRGGNLAQFGPPVYYFDKKTGKTYNSMGLANIGEQKALRLMPEFLKLAHAKKKIVIHSVSRSVEDELGDAVDQTIKLAKDFLGAGADLVELNLSTPNTVTKDGGRAPIMGLDVQTVKELAAGLAKLPKANKIGLKMPPYLSKPEQAAVPELARIINNLRPGFITVCNTIPGQAPKDDNGQDILSVPGGHGGMSGPATKDVGREQLALWKKHLGKHVDIISLLGVDSAAEFKRRLDMGAAAGGGVTFLRESHDWPKTVARMLQQI